MFKILKSFFGKFFGKAEVVVEKVEAVAEKVEAVAEKVEAVAKKVAKETKVIEERMAQSAEKNITAKEIKSKSKPVVKTDEVEVVKKRKPRRKSTKKPKTEE